MKRSKLFNLVQGERIVLVCEKKFMGLDDFVSDMNLLETAKSTNFEGNFNTRYKG